MAAASVDVFIPASSVVSGDNGSTLTLSFPTLSSGFNTRDVALNIKVGDAKATKVKPYYLSAAATNVSPVAFQFTRNEIVRSAEGRISGDILFTIAPNPQASPASLKVGDACSVRTLPMFGACSVARSAGCRYTRHMQSSRSPRKVMVLAYRLGAAHLPAYSSRFSRKDRATLPQLFACLVLRQFYNLSYRRVEALLRDGRGLCRAIGMKRVPDHNTLCDAFDTLVKLEHFAPMLDELTRAFEEAGLLKLDEKPLALDSTHFESHHVSRHFAERRKRAERKKTKRASKSKESKRSARGSSKRSTTVSNLPKLAIAVAGACHLICSFWSGTGMGGDHPHFETLAYHAWRRAPVKTIVADAGYDKEAHHDLVRDDLNCASYIPPLIGRPSENDPTERWRLLMKQTWDEPDVKAIYGQRWQVETVNSMLKRNYGSSLRARTPQRREREMLLKAMTHNIAL